MGSQQVSSTGLVSGLQIQSFFINKDIIKYPPSDKERVRPRYLLPLDEWVYQPTTANIQTTSWPGGAYTIPASSLGHKLERVVANKRQLKPIDWPFQASFHIGTN